LNLLKLTPWPCGPVKIRNPKEVSNRTKSLIWLSCPIAAYFVNLTFVGVTRQSDLDRLFD